MMEDFGSINKEIVAKVRSFRDDVVAGRVRADLIRKHKIPDAYLDVCRDPNHPSSKKLINRLFEYLMSKVGYYKNLGNIDALAELNANLNGLLQKPIEEESQQELYVPRFILAVNKTLDHIERLNGSKQIGFAEKALVKNVEFGKKGRSFLLSYTRSSKVSVAFEGFSTPASKIQIEGEDIDVPEKGAHLSSRVITFTQPDAVSIEFDKFHHSSIKDDKSYYFRYITEVSAGEDLRRTFVTSYFDVDGIDTFAIEAKVDGKQLLLYFYPHNDKNYLIIEYNERMTAQAMNDLAFSTLVALGMITTDVLLDECWLAAYESSDKQNEAGLFFQSLVPTIHCDYAIFTTNVYPSLVHVAKNIDPVNGEHKACDLISKLKLSRAFPEFPSEVFGRLVENMRKYEDLQRGIFIILMGSKLHLEIQAATYCVALEAIANVAPKVIGEQKKVIITRKKDWKQVLKRFRALSQELFQQQVITESEKKDIDKKIETMNKAFNSEKLRALLVHYKYPIKQFDDLTLFLRNLLLHGNISFDLIKDRKPEDYLFELSMNLHKLCCAIALLMSGYKGYIINNRKLYDFPNSYKAFIRIGDNVKVDYPEYKEKKSFWKRVCDVLHIFRVNWYS